MTEEEVKVLIEKAHRIFGKTSIYEVIDMDHESAVATLVEFYGPADMEDVERYLAILDLILEDEEAPRQKKCVLICRNRDSIPRFSLTG